MKTTRKCAFCGKEFVVRSGMQKYCSEQCQTKAKEARKKKQRDFINAVEPVIDVQSHLASTSTLSQRTSVSVTTTTT